METTQLVEGDNLETLLFEDIKAELGISSSKKAARVIKKVFRTIQKSLSPAEIKLLLQKLPDFLQLLFISEWRQSESHSSLEHLDEWVESIHQEEEIARTKTFHSEIEILKAIVLLMNRLDKLCGVLSFPGLRFSLVREIKQASQFSN